MQRTRVAQERPREMRNLHTYLVRFPINRPTLVKKQGTPAFLSDHPRNRGTAPLGAKKRVD